MKILNILINRLKDLQPLLRNCGQCLQYPPKLFFFLSLFFLLGLLLQISKFQRTIKINNSSYVAASLCEQFSSECSDFLLGQLFKKTPMKSFYLFREPSSPQCSSTKLQTQWLRCFIHSSLKKIGHYKNQIKNFFMRFTYSGSKGEQPYQIIRQRVFVLEAFMKAKKQ